MGTLLIIILLGIIFWPLLKLLWRLGTQAYRINRFMKDPSLFFNGFETGGNTRTRREEPKRRRGKKFGKDVGEYVDFTDVACNVENTAANEVQFKQEEQVTDIEWVDIEDK